MKTLRLFLTVLVLLTLSSLPVEGHRGTFTWSPRTCNDCSEMIGPPAPPATETVSRQTTLEYDVETDMLWLSQQLAVIVTYQTHIVAYSGNERLNSDEFFATVGWLNGSWATIIVNFTIEVSDEGGLQYVAKELLIHLTPITNE